MNMKNIQYLGMIILLIIAPNCVSDRNRIAVLLNKSQEKEVLLAKLKGDLVGITKELIRDRILTIEQLDSIANEDILHLENLKEGDLTEELKEELLKLISLLIEEDVIDSKYISDYLSNK